MLEELDELNDEDLAELAEATERSPEIVREIRIRLYEDALDYIRRGIYPIEQMGILVEYKVDIQMVVRFMEQYGVRDTPEEEQSSEEELLEESSADDEEEDPFDILGVRVNPRRR